MNVLTLEVVLCTIRTDRTFLVFLRGNYKSFVFLRATPLQALRCKGLDVIFATCLP